MDIGFGAKVAAAVGDEDDEVSSSDMTVLIFIGSDSLGMDIVTGYAGADSLL